MTPRSLTPEPESSAFRLIIGSRGSALALIQARWVEIALRRSVPGAVPQILMIKTDGDRSPTAPLTSGTTVGLFVRKIENALSTGRIDLAVHSLKDLPATQPPKLTIAAIPAREDVRDVLVLREGNGLDDLPSGARLGTGSPRRIGQIRALRPDLRFHAIRGNVDTRLLKLERGEVDGLVLAAAGLNRLGISRESFHPFSLAQVLPAPGQGALAVEIRTEDRGLAELLARSLDHPATSVAVRAERSMLLALGGGCQMPVGALGVVEGDELKLEGVVASPDGSRLVRRCERGALTEAEKIGRKLADLLIAEGAGEILSEISLDRVVT